MVRKRLDPTFQRRWCAVLRHLISNLEGKVMPQQGATILTSSSLSAYTHIEYQGQIADSVLTLQGQYSTDMPSIGKLLKTY